MFFQGFIKELIAYQFEYCNSCYQQFLEVEKKPSNTEGTFFSLKYLHYNKRLL